MICILTVYTDTIPKQNKMNYMVINSICCCLNLCCKQLWQSLYKIIGKQAFIKFTYLLIYTTSVILSLAGISILNQSWKWFMETLAPGIDCKTGIGVATQYHNCLSASVAYRISFALLVLSVAVLAVLQACTTRVGLVLNEGLFFSKFVIVMVVFFGTLRVGNQVFMVYGDIAEIISYFFVAVQSIILIDLAYLWGIKWAKNYSEGSQKYGALLIGFSIGMLGGSLILLILSFSAHHQILLWADILCAIQVTTMIGVQLLNFNKQNSLLTTSSLCLLISYLTWNAGYSHPLASQDNGIQSQTMLYVNMVIMGILLIMSTAGSIYGASNVEDDDKFIDLDDINAGSQQQQIQVEQNRKWSKWALYLMGMSAYIAMLVTDWGSADLVEKQFNLTIGAWMSKFFMTSIVFVLYTWTLLAPRLCPHRNFYFE